MPETVVHFQIRMPPDIHERLASWAKCARTVVRRGPIIIKTALPGSSKIFTFAHVRSLVLRHSFDRGADPELCRTPPCSRSSHN